MRAEAPWLDDSQIADFLDRIAKPAGKNYDETLAKRIIEDGPGGMSESDFVKMWRAECQPDRRANETSEECFAHYKDSSSYDKRQLWMRSGAARTNITRGCARLRLRTTPAA
jgi:hypothetical protein